MSKYGPALNEGMEQRRDLLHMYDVVSNEHSALIRQFRATPWWNLPKRWKLWSEANVKFRACNMIFFLLRGRRGAPYE